MIEIWIYFTALQQKRSDQVTTHRDTVLEMLGQYLKGKLHQLEEKYFRLSTKIPWYSFWSLWNPSYLVEELLQNFTTVYHTAKEHIDQLFLDSVLFLLVEFLPKFPSKYWFLDIYLHNYVVSTCNFILLWFGKVQAVVS